MQTETLGDGQTHGRDAGKEDCRSGRGGDCYAGPTETAHGKETEILKQLSY